MLFVFLFVSVLVLSVAGCVVVGCVDGFSSVSLFVVFPFVVPLLLFALFVGSVLFVLLFSVFVLVLVFVAPFVPLKIIF